MYFLINPEESYFGSFRYIQLVFAGSIHSFLLMWHSSVCIWINVADVNASNFRYSNSDVAGDEH